jgi:hypothetical protein
MGRKIQKECDYTLSRLISVPGTTDESVLMKLHLKWASYLSIYLFVVCLTMLFQLLKLYSIE